MIKLRDVKNGKASMSSPSNLQDQILDDLADSMRKDIDDAFRFEVARTIGWQYVAISRLQDNNHAVDITHWLVENVKDNTYYRNGREFVFEDPQDAVLFTLRWAG